MEYYDSLIISKQERGLASQRPLGRPAGIMPNLTNQMFCWKIADKFDLDLRVMIIVWVCILQKIWAHLAPNTIKIMLQKIGNFCHQNGRSLYSPYYKVGIAENLGTLANKILGVYILLTIMTLQNPKFGHTCPQKVRSLDSPYYRGDIAENLGTFCTKMEGV